jgi:hypothetical protein
MRASEGAALVAEEFSFNKRLWDGGAVDIDESMIAPWTEIMDGAGGEFFAGSRGSGNQYGSVSWCNAFNNREQFPHHRRLANESGSFGIA